jgi:hypothetical protein
MTDEAGSRATGQEAVSGQNLRNKTGRYSALRRRLRMPGQSDGDLLARAGTAVAFEITSRAIFAFGLIALVSAREGDIMIQPYPLTATPGLDPAPDVPTLEEIGQAGTAPWRRLPEPTGVQVRRRDQLSNVRRAPKSGTWY